MAAYSSVYRFYSIYKKFVLVKIGYTESKMSHYSKTSIFFLDLVSHNYASRHFFAIFTKFQKNLHNIFKKRKKSAKFLLPMFFLRDIR